MCRCQVPSYLVVKCFRLVKWIWGEWGQFQSTRHIYDKQYAYTYFLHITLSCSRLEDYEKLFGQLINDPETAFKIVVPNPEHFREITSDSGMPMFTMDGLEAFCVLTERLNIEKSHNMYERKSMCFRNEEKYILQCNTKIQTSHDLGSSVWMCWTLWSM